MAKMKSIARVREESSDVTRSTAARPSIDDRLLQALHILKLCSKADHDRDSDEGFELSFPMCAEISLLESVSTQITWEGRLRETLQAESIVKACAVAMRSDDKAIFGANGFEVSWPLFAAIELIEGAIRHRSARAAAGLTADMDR